MNGRLSIALNHLFRFLAASLRASACVKLLCLAALSVLISSLIGCAAFSGGDLQRRGGSRDLVDELHLFGLPKALDFDQKPGPDGFAIRIYASNFNEAKGIPIKTGTLEILMFDGLLTEQNSASQTPSRIWTFTAHELRSHANKSEIGIGYLFALRWENAVPTRDRITIVARYSSSRGQISSAPSTISVAVK